MLNTNFAMHPTSSNKLHILYLIMTKMRILLAISCLFLFIHQGFTQNVSFDNSIIQYSISSQDLFGSKQEICIVEIPKKLFNDHKLELAYDEKHLIKTSEFATKNNAIVAINAGFFDVIRGGSVTYLEVDDEPHFRISSDKDLYNGVLIISKNNTIEIEKRKTDTTYLNSDLEKAVLVTGPLLIDDGIPVKLDTVKFATKRHPRSCLCTNDEGDILLIVVDGRSKLAAGMSLFELQDFLLWKGCYEAINLDGGGSSTLWTEEHGILNQPSDFTGERPVANIIYLRKSEP